MAELLYRKMREGMISSQHVLIHSATQAHSVDDVVLRERDFGVPASDYDSISSDCVCTTGCTRHHRVVAASDCTRPH